MKRKNMSFKNKEVLRKKLKKQNYLNQNVIKADFNYNNEASKEFYIHKSTENSDLYVQN